ncbi:MAG: 4Fe-4S ferredoxin [Desulfobacterales bacterium]|nr:4Fe-4S ferredoxin [Desulfobacterales bacterium]
MKILRKIIEIDEELCDGCGQCVPSCAEGALEIAGGKARIVQDRLCDGLGACLGECPTGALRVVERGADEFDEEAVGQHLSEMEKNDSEDMIPRACPSAGLQMFAPKTSLETCKRPIPDAGDSALSHWPVKIRLVPPNAPFLKSSDLLVLADCVSAAYPRTHQDFIKEKVILMGCPKFDEVQPYIDKFSEIFKSAGIKSITSVVMEVPCCSGLPIIVKEGLEKAGVKIPHEIVVVSTRGDILSRIEG